MVFPEQGSGAGAGVKGSHARASHDHRHHLHQLPWSFRHILHSALAAWLLVWVKNLCSNTWDYKETKREEISQHHSWLMHANLQRITWQWLLMQLWFEETCCSLWPTSSWRALCFVGRIPRVGLPITQSTQSTSSLCTLRRRWNKKNCKIWLTD